MANKQINELSELTTPASGDLIAVYDLDEAGSEKTKKVSKSNLITTTGWEEFETDTVSVNLVVLVPGDSGSSKWVRCLGGFTVDNPADRHLAYVYFNNDTTTTNYQSHAGNTNQLFDAASGLDFITIDLLCNVDTKMASGKIVYERSGTITNVDNYLIHTPAAACDRITFYLYNWTKSNTSQINAGSISSYIWK